MINYSYIEYFLDFSLMTQLCFRRNILFFKTLYCQEQKTLLNNGLNVAFREVEVYYLGVIEKYMTSMGVFRDQFKEMGHPDLKK